MRLRWEQIDPHIAVKAGAEIARIRSEEASRTRETETQNARVVTRVVGTPAVPRHESLAAIWHILAACVAVLFVLLYMTVFFHLTGPEGTLALTVVPMGILTLGCVVPSTKNRTAPRLRGRIPQELLPTLISDTSATRAEQLYGDLIVLLSNENNSKGRRQTERLHKELLRQCNTLLADHRRIELHKNRVQSLIDTSESVTAIDAERAALICRMEAETDPIARRSLAESVELCAERSDSIQSLPPTLNRLDAHNEVICQALSLARAAITRSQATPVSLNAPDVSGLRATVRRVTHETRAVEEVVHEIDLYLK